MRWYLTIAALLVAFPVGAQENEAEKLYRGFEKKLTDAKVFNVTFDIKGEAKEAIDVKGVVLVAAGNKLKLAVEGKVRGKPMKATLVSNGKTLSMKAEHDGRNDAKEQDAPELLNEYFVGYLIRAGLYLGVESATRPQPESKPSLVKLSDFKMLGKEKVGDREAVVIEYTLELPGQKIVPHCKVWFDPKTNMPIKRLLEAKNEVGGGVEMQLTEVYGAWQLGPTLPKDAFDLPK